MYDIFFISFDEPNADENWQNLKTRFNRAKRVHGVKGINNAHAACAEQAITKMFWTVDADTLVDSDFTFDYPVMPWDEKYLHIWYSRNPVNYLEYGYGSVKLWPVSTAKKKTDTWLDFTTTIGKIKLTEQTVSTTVFNTDPFNAWKSGLREAVKLSATVYSTKNTDAAKRLIGWTDTKSSANYAEQTVNGVLTGIDYFLNNKDNVDKLRLINDFDWLKQQFVEPTNDFDKQELLEKIGIYNV